MKRADLIILTLFATAVIFLSSQTGKTQEIMDSFDGKTANFKGKEGCYVLKDSAGRWNVFWLGTASTTVTGKIWSEGELLVETADSAASVVLMPERRIIYFKGDVLEFPVGFRFAFSTTSFNIDILIDQRRMPHKVFLGEGRTSPSTLPIRVQDIISSDDSFLLNHKQQGSTKESQKIKGFRGVESRGEITGLAPEEDSSLLETPPAATSHTVDRRSGSSALRLPDSLRGWPPVMPPEPRDRYDWFAPDDTTSSITEVYEVATGKVHRVDKRGAEKSAGKEE